MASRSADVPAADVPGEQRVDIGRAFRQELFLGALLPTVIGVAGVAAAVTGATTGGAGTRVAAGVIGAVFLAGGLGLFFWLFARTPRAWLVVSAAGVRHERTRGADWELAWGDISSATLIRTRLNYFRGTALSPRGPRFSFPRHYLDLRVSRAALRRPEIHDLVMGTRSADVRVDLGLPARQAHDVRAALGTHLSSPTIERVRGPIG